MSEKDKEQNTSNQKRERKSVRVNLRITETESNGLNLVSFNDDEAISQVIRKAIRMYVNMRKSTY